MTMPDPYDDQAIQPGGAEITARHEATVVGTMLMHPRCVDDVAGLVQGCEFRDPRLETVFDMVCRLHMSGSPVSPVSVGDALAADKQLTRIGGIARLSELASLAAIPEAVAYHARRVHDAAIVRGVAVVGARLTQLAEDASPDADVALEVVNAARGELDGLVIDDRSEVPHSVAVMQSLDVLDEGPGTPTAWPSLTKLITGWRAGCMYLIGSRPATGKSVVVVQAALDVARRGQTAVIFSLEMSKVELYHRMLSGAAGVDMESIQKRTVTPHDRERLKAAARDISRLPLVVDDTAQTTVPQMMARVRAEQRRRPVGIVVVDYLGLAGAERNHDRRVQVDQISRGLKVLAKELGVPVLAASQLNRGVEHRAAGEPILADLRESGGLEQDADAVVLLHRPRDSNTGEMIDDLSMIVAKNRHGRTGRVEFVFDGAHSLVSERPSLWRP